MSGWFAIKHGIRKHPIFKGRPDRLGAWVAMLDEAAFIDIKQDVSGVTVDVRRGELCASQAMLEEITGLSRQQLRTFLSALERAGTISTRPATKSTKSRTIVTFCNYDRYQTPQPKSNQASTKHQPTKEQYNNKTNTFSNEKEQASPVPISVLTKAVWDCGIQYLTSKGIDDRQARSVLGKWRKDSRDAQILEAIEAAQRAGTEDPIPYITKILKGDETFDVMAALEKLRKERG